MGREKKRSQNLDFLRLANFFFAFAWRKIAKVVCDYPLFATPKRKYGCSECWNYFEAVVYNLGDLMYLSRLKLLTLFNLIRFN